MRKKIGVKTTLPQFPTEHYSRLLLSICEAYPSSATSTWSNNHRSSFKKKYFERKLYSLILILKAQTQSLSLNSIYLNNSSSKTDSRYKKDITSFHLIKPSWFITDLFKMTCLFCGVLINSSKIDSSFYKSYSHKTLPLFLHSRQKSITFNPSTMIMQFENPKTQNCPTIFKKFWW